MQPSANAWVQLHCHAGCAAMICAYLQACFTFLLCITFSMDHLHRQGFDSQQNCTRKQTALQVKAGTAWALGMISKSCTERHVDFTVLAQT